LYDGVTKEPTTDNHCAATAQQHNDHDADDDGGIVLLGFFTGCNRHFIHDFFSFDMGWIKNVD
jgi:hypothetical protein